METSAVPIGLLVAAVLGLAAYGVLIASAHRADERPVAGPLTVYLGAVMLVMLVVALLAAGQAAIALVEQGLGLGAGADALPRPGRPGATAVMEGSPTAELWGSIVTALLAAGAFEVHRRWLLRVRRAEVVSGPAGGVFRSYLYAVCLASLVALVLAGAGIASGTARALSSEGGPRDEIPARPGRGGPSVGRPSSFSQQERDAGLAEVIGNSVLAAFAFGLFAVHWRWAGEVRDAGRDEEREPEEPA